MFERIVILCNPGSTGAHKTDHRIYELHKLLPDAKIVKIRTSPDGYAANVAILNANRYLFGEKTLLCIAGGDGTVNLAVNYLLAESALSAEALRMRVQTAEDRPGASGCRRARLPSPAP